MLILTRKLDDSLIIEVEGLEEQIEVKITELTAGQVRLGITAPKSCKIWRKELYQTVVSNRQSASNNTSTSELRDLRQRLQDLK